MSKRFREARLMKNIKLIDAAKLLDVSQPTLSAWEGERKSPSIENLARMADLYEVTTDYLLGRDPDFMFEPGKPVQKEALPVLHGKPVWIPSKGWALVNGIDNIFLFTSGEHFQFTETDSVMLASERFSDPVVPCGKPLDRKDLAAYEEIWIEPISADSALRQELRGWYSQKGCYFENHSGNRFTFDTYGSKWLAFENQV